MSQDPTSTTMHPAFTTKKAMLKALYQAMEPNCTDLDVLFQVNNTDVTGLADGASVFDTADIFEST